MKRVLYWMLSSYYTIGMSQLMLTCFKAAQLLIRGHSRDHIGMVLFSAIIFSIGRPSTFVIGKFVWT